MLRCFAINYRRGMFSATFDAFGLQVRRNDTWAFSWTPEFHWLLEVKDGAGWREAWRWDRRVRFWPAFSRQAATV